MELVISGEVHNVYVRLGVYVEVDGRYIEWGELAAVDIIELTTMACGLCARIRSIGTTN